MFFYHTDIYSDNYSINQKDKSIRDEYTKVFDLMTYIHDKGQLTKEFNSKKILIEDIEKQLRLIEREELDEIKDKSISIKKDQKEDISKNIELIQNTPKICIYTASPLNNKIDYKLNSVLNLFKKYQVDITHKVLNENELLEFREFDYNLIFTNLNKEKIIIEDEYFVQKSITLNQLEELVYTDNVVLFLDNVIENTQFNIKKKINKEIVRFLYNNFKNNLGHSQEHPLKTKLPDAIDITKLNGFIGRYTDIETITRKILTIKEEHKILTIKGAGGLGKTTLISKIAVEIAKRGKYKDGIEFVRCEYIKDYEDFENKITFAFDMSNAFNFKEQLKDLYEDEDRLIILDNIETFLNIDDTKEIKELIHFISNYATIVTTSREILKENGFEEVYELKELSTDEAEKLFVDISKIKKYDKKQLRIEILENKLSNNPLAITLVANNLSKHKTTHQIKKELDDNFISMTTSDLEEIFDRDSDNNIQRLESLFSSINYSYIKLSEKEKLALELLSLFPDGIHFDNFKEFYNQKVDKVITDEEERKQKINEISVIKLDNFSDKDLKSLEDKSLIINNNQNINLQSIIGRFSNFIFNKRNQEKKIEFYNKAYTYNTYILKLLDDLNIDNTIRAQIFDKNKNNFLKCLEYFNHIDLDYNNYNFIDRLCLKFSMDSAPNKRIFEKLSKLKLTIVDDKINKEFFEVTILKLKYFYSDFNSIYHLICEKFPLKKVIKSYKNSNGIKLLTIGNLVNIYNMEGKQYQLIKLSQLKNIFNLAVFEIGEYTIFEKYLKKYELNNKYLQFEFKLNNNELSLKELKKYINSLYKTQIIEKIQSSYILLKVDESEIKLKFIKKLIVTNPFTDGLKILMLAIKKDNISSKIMYEDAIEKLYHIRYYHVEAIYLYCKYLKNNKDEDYNKWFKDGKELAQKHHYRYLLHQFICLDKNKNDIDKKKPYNEDDYPLPEPLDYSKIIKKYDLKGL